MKTILIAMALLTVPAFAAKNLSRIELRIRPDDTGVAFSTMEAIAYIGTTDDAQLTKTRIYPVNLSASQVKAISDLYNAAMTALKSAESIP